MKANNKTGVHRSLPAVVTSTYWISRNDSSNIRAILHASEDHHQLNAPVLKYEKKIKGDILVKKILGKNKSSCRCTSGPQTKIIRKSKTYNWAPKNDKNAATKCTCKNANSKISSGELKLESTNPRKKYEEQVLHKEKLQEIEENKEIYEENEKTRKKNSATYSNNNDKVDTILETQGFNSTATSVTNYLQQQDLNEIYSKERSSLEDIPTDEFPVFSESEWSVPEFRKEHYFETHDIGKLKNISEDISKEQHVCVHKFTLDKRHLLEPLNKDPFGRSLCKICDKPMEGSTLNLSCGLFSKDRIMSKSKLTNYVEAAQKQSYYSNSIHLGRVKSQIELVLTPSDVTKFSSYINKVKKPEYRNSLALRHQKMRIS